MSQSQADDGLSPETWRNKQDFIVRFINELGTVVDNKAAEFEIPPIVIIGALEMLKQEWMVSMMPTGIRDLEDDEPEDDINPPPGS